MSATKADRPNPATVTRTDQEDGHDHHVKVHADESVDRLQIAERHVQAKFPGAKVVRTRHFGERCPHGELVVEVLYYLPRHPDPRRPLSAVNWSTSARRQRR